jgi:hypothetical protein
VPIVNPPAPRAATYNGLLPIGRDSRGGEQCLQVHGHPRIGMLDHRGACVGQTKIGHWLISVI